jgi:hypothetical protein
MNSTDEMLVNVLHPYQGGLLVTTEGRLKYGILLMRLRRQFTIHFQ